MGKPLLTDEIIARANRGEYDDEETKVLDRHMLDDYVSDRNYWDEATNQTFSAEDAIPSNREKIYKSRRIENERRSGFQHKLNRYFLIVIILLAILIYAIFNW